MSYILEAIRKSDAQRAKKSPQKPVRLLEAPPRKQGPWGKWLVVALVTLAATNIATLAYYHGKSDKTTGGLAAPEQMDPSEPEPRAAPILSQQTGKPAPVPGERGALQPDAPLASRYAELAVKRALLTSLRFPSASTPTFGQEAAKRPSSPRSRTPTGIKPAMPPLPRTFYPANKNIHRVAQPLESVGVPEPAEPPGSKEIPFFNELPSGLRRQIPPIKVNVHAYSRLPQERFVIVGTTKYRPGQPIGDELVLEEVTRDGLVLSFQDQRFRLRRP